MPYLWIDFLMIRLLFIAGLLYMIWDYLMYAFWLLPIMLCFLAVRAITNRAARPQPNPVESACPNKRYQYMSLYWNCLVEDYMKDRFGVEVLHTRNSEWACKEWYE